MQMAYVSSPFYMFYAEINCAMAAGVLLWTVIRRGVWNVTCWLLVITTIMWLLEAGYTMETHMEHSVWWMLLLAITFITALTWVLTEADRKMSHPD